MNNKNNIVFGTGPLGVWVAILLSKQGGNVTMINSRGILPYANLAKNITIKAVDLTNADHVNKVCQNADCVFHCAMPPYTQWAGNFDNMTQGIIRGLENTGVKLIYGDNLYAYGETNSKPIAENSPCHAKSKKGKIRAKAANDLLNCSIDVAIVRGSDFFGPYVNNAMLGVDFFQNVLNGKTINLLGNIDLPHSYTYIKDFANSMINLSNYDEGFNQIWHVPNAPTITTRQWVKLVEEQIKQPIKIRTAGNLLVSILGLFNPMLKEVKEMMYQWQQPYIVEHQKYSTKFGLNFTPHKEAIHETIKWYKLQ